MSAGRRAAALLLALLPLGGCGANLLVLRHEAELRSADGDRHVLEVEYRPPHGFLWQDDTPVASAVLGLLLEPLDWLASTGTAITAPFRPDDYVLGGPLGWLAALTPFATLVPDLQFPPRRQVEVDPATLRRLHAEAAGERTAAAQELLGDARIRWARLRREPGGERPK